MSDSSIGNNLNLLVALLSFWAFSDPENKMNPHLSEIFESVEAIENMILTS